MRPKRFQHRPGSLNVTIMHSAWWTLGPLEFSVWHFPNHKTPDRYTGRVALRLAGHVWNIDIQRAA